MIAETHAAAIAAVPGARLVAVTDVAPERGARFARGRGCAAEPGLDALLARDDIDVVSVCVPSGLHAAALDVASHAAQIADLLTAVEQGREPSVTGRSGRDALEVVCAVYESAREGRPGRATARCGRRWPRWRPRAFPGTPRWNRPWRRRAGTGGSAGRRSSAGPPRP